MIQKFNPAELEFCKQASDFSIQLVQEWLVKYKFASSKKSDKVKKSLAKRIAKKLDDSKKWKLHSYPLNKKELTELGLKIEDITGDTLKKMKDLCYIIDNIISLYKLPSFIKFNQSITNFNTGNKHREQKT